MKSSEAEAAEPARLQLGTILCSKCNEFIAELDTERVMIIYGLCDREQCRSSDSSESDC